MKEPNYILFTLFIATLLLCYTGIWIYRLRNTSGDKRFVTLYHLAQSTSIAFVFSLGVAVAILIDDDVPAAVSIAQLTGEEAYGAINDFVAACLIGIYVFGSFKIGQLLGSRTFIYFAQNKIGRVRAEQICRNENC